MAKYSLSSENDEGEVAPTTSTPLLESTYVHRRKRRLKNYILLVPVGLLFTLIETYSEV